MASHGLYVQARAPWYASVRAELLSFPAGRNDDIVDMLGLFGQLLETAMRGQPLRPKKPPTPKDRWDKVFGEDDGVQNWKLA